MKSSNLMLAVFGLVVVVQLAAPASLIISRERVLKEGVIFMFKTAPVDPYDAFRGRYVALNFEQHSAPVTAGQDFANGGKGFATIAVGTDGFARFTAVKRQPPVNQPYLRVHVIPNYGGGQVLLELPFDCFYMEETQAPAAEKIYREHSRRGGQQDTYAQVRIRNGIGVIENLYVGGKPIAEQIARHK